MNELEVEFDGLGGEILNSLQKAKEENERIFPEKAISRALESREPSDIDFFKLSFFFILQQTVQKIIYRTSWKIVN